MTYREILEACWDGYRRKPGTTEYSKGSCEKISEQDIEENLRNWFKEKWVVETNPKWSLGDSDTVTYE